MRISCVIATTLTLAYPSLANTVAGTDGKNELGYLQCAATASAQATDCAYEMLRKDDGTATLRVLFPGGVGRSVYLDNGAVTGSSSPDKITSETLGNGGMIIFLGTEMRIEVPAEVLAPAN